MLGCDAHHGGSERAAADNHRRVKCKVLVLSAALTEDTIRVVEGEDALKAFVDNFIGPLIASITIVRHLFPYLPAPLHVVLHLTLLLSRSSFPLQNILRFAFYLFP
jgi:hypothetical protein